MRTVKSSIQKIDALFFGNRIKSLYRFHLDAASLKFAPTYRKMVIKYPQPKDGLSALFLNTGQIREVHMLNHIHKPAGNLTHMRIFTLSIYCDPTLIYWTIP